MELPNDDFLEIVKILAVRIPEMAILLLGIMLSLAYWRKYPGPALLSFLGFSMLLLQILTWEIILFLMQEYNPPLGDVFFFIAEGVRSLITAGAYLLLIFAIHAGRRPVPPMPPYQ